LIPRPDPLGRPPDPGESGIGQYGDPQPVELASLAGDAGVYQRQNVRGRGMVGVIQAHLIYTLRDGVFQVLPIPTGTISASARLIGLRIEVTGVARNTRPKQYVNGGARALTEARPLPGLPAPTTSLPRGSRPVPPLPALSPPDNRAAPAELARNIA